MKLFSRKSKPVEIEPIRLDLVTPLHIDHKITHSYEAKPRPQDIQIRLYNQENGQSWTAYFSFPGQKVQVPGYALNLDMSDGRTIEMQVIW
jgi:hypothetical protein